MRNKAKRKPTLAAPKPPVQPESRRGMSPSHFQPLTSHDCRYLPGLVNIYIAKITILTQTIVIMFIMYKPVMVSIAM